MHGEPEGQEVLKQKIEEAVEVPVIIPEFGESYELTGEGVQKLELSERVQMFNAEFIRLDLIDRIEKMKDDIEELENSVKEESFETNNEDIKTLSNRIKDIELQIANLMR